MTVFRVTLDDLPKEVQDRLLGAAREIARSALRSAALACQARLAQVTPVYTGMAKAGWQVKQIPGHRDGWQLTNPVPYIGVVEEGARPHPVSQEGVDALARWFELKVGLSKKEASSAAYAYAWKLRREGQKGTFFIKNHLPELERISRAEVRRHLERYARQRAPKS